MAFHSNNSLFFFISRGSQRCNCKSLAFSSRHCSPTSTLRSTCSRLRFNSNLSQGNYEGNAFKPSFSSSTKSKGEKTSNAVKRAKSKTIPYAILLVSFSLSFYYLSQDGRIPLIQSSPSNLIKPQPLQEHRYVSLPVLSSHLSVSPSLSRLDKADETQTQTDSIGDAQHKHLSIQLNQSQSDSLKEEAKLQDLNPSLRIMSIYLKEPTLQIERAYTPLYDVFTGNSSTHSSGSSTAILDLIIKRYQDGELSRYAHKLRPPYPSQKADEIENLAHVRGPVTTWSWQKEKTPDEIIMIVGGTGITPAFQLLTNVLGKPKDPLISFPSSPVTAASSQSPLSTSTPTSYRSDKPKFTLLYSAPSASSLLLLPELLSLRNQNPENLQVGLWVENPPARTKSTSVIGNDSLVKSTSTTWMDMITSLFPGDPSRKNSEDQRLDLRNGRIGEKELQEWLGSKVDSKGQRVILVCGPDGMVSAISGPKASDGKSQGPIGGILGKLGWSNEDVWKL